MEAFTAVAVAPALDGRARVVPHTASRYRGGISSSFFPAFQRFFIRSYGSGRCSPSMA